MAYATKYRFNPTKTDIGQTHTHEILLQKKDYNGPVTDIKLTPDNGGFKLKYENIDPKNFFDKAIQKSSFTLDLQVLKRGDTKPIGYDGYAIQQDIFSGQEDTFKLIYKVDGSIVWKGWVLPGMMEWPEGQHVYTASIKAKDLTRLTGVDYDFSDDPQTNFKRLIIKQIAAQVATLDLDMPFRCFTGWTESHINSTESFLGQVYTNPARLKDSENALDALTKTLEAYNLTMRQVNGEWQLFQRSGLQTPTTATYSLYKPDGSFDHNGTKDLTDNGIGSNKYIQPDSKNSQNDAVKKLKGAFESDKNLSKITLTGQHGKDVPSPLPVPDESSVYYFETDPMPYTNSTEDTMRISFTVDMWVDENAHTLEYRPAIFLYNGSRFLRNVFGVFDNDIEQGNMIFTANKGFNTVTYDSGDLVETVGGDKHYSKDISITVPYDADGVNAPYGLSMGFRTGRFKFKKGGFLGIGDKTHVHYAEKTEFTNVDVEVYDSGAGESSGSNLIDSKYQSVILDKNPNSTVKRFDFKPQHIVNSGNTHLSLDFKFAPHAVQVGDSIEGGPRMPVWISLQVADNSGNWYYLTQQSSGFGSTWDKFSTETRDFPFDSAGNDKYYDGWLQDPQTDTEGFVIRTGIQVTQWLDGTDQKGSEQYYNLHVESDVLPNDVPDIPEVRLALFVPKLKNETGDYRMDSIKYKDFNFSIEDGQGNARDANKITYSLTQQGNYSLNKDISDTLFGNAGDASAHSDLFYGQKDQSKLITSTWGFVGGATDSSLILQRMEEMLSTRRSYSFGYNYNIRGFYDLANILQYKGKNILFIGGEYSYATNTYNNQYVELAFAQDTDDTDVFEVAGDNENEGSSGGSGSGGGGSVSGGNIDYNEASKIFLNEAKNLNDLANKTTARDNLSVYSKSEANNRFLQIANELSEITDIQGTKAFQNSITGTSGGFSGALSADTLRTTSGDFLSPNPYRFRNAGDSAYRNIHANGATFEGDVGSSGYVSGILGAGTRWDVANSFFEVDNMRIRNELRAHIFKKDIVKASNGYLFITDSAEIAQTATIADTTDTFKIVGEDGNATFDSGDLVWFKSIDDNGSLQINGVKLTVGSQASTGTTNGTNWIEYNIQAVKNGGSLIEGGTIVRVSGGYLLNDASSQYAPFLDVYDGVNTWNDFQSSDKLKGRYGNLNGLTIDGVSLNGYGLYSNNVYLTDSILIGDFTENSNYLKFNGSSLTIDTDSFNLKSGNGDKWRTIDNTFQFGGANGIKYSGSGNIILGTDTEVHGDLYGVGGYFGKLVSVGDNGNVLIDPTPTNGIPTADFVDGTAQTYNSGAGYKIYASDGSGGLGRTPLYTAVSDGIVAFTFEYRIYVNTQVDQLELVSTVDTAPVGSNLDGAVFDGITKKDLASTGTSYVTAKNTVVLDVESGEDVYGEGRYKDFVGGSIDKIEVLITSKEYLPKITITENNIYISNITGTAKPLSADISGNGEALLSSPITSWDNITGKPTFNISNWNTAYAWGDHAQAGYYKSGDSPSFNSLTLGNNDLGDGSIGNGIDFGSAGIYRLQQSTDPDASGLAFYTHPSATSSDPQTLALVIGRFGNANFQKQLSRDGNTVWDAGNLPNPFESTGGVITGSIYAERGITGGYSNTTGNGNNWGANIWAIGSGFSSNEAGTSFSIGNHYGLAWLRATNVDARGDVQEGLYLYQNGALFAGIGSEGNYLREDLNIGGKLTAPEVLTDTLIAELFKKNETRVMNSKFVFSDGSLTTSAYESSSLEIKVKQQLFQSGDWVEVSWETTNGFVNQIVHIDGTVTGGYSFGTDYVGSLTPWPENATVARIAGAGNRGNYMYINADGDPYLGIYNNVTSYSNSPFNDDQSNLTTLLGDLSPAGLPGRGIAANSQGDNVFYINANSAKIGGANFNKKGMWSANNAGIDTGGFKDTGLYINFEQELISMGDLFWFDSRTGNESRFAGAYFDNETIWSTGSSSSSDRVDAQWALDDNGYRMRADTGNINRFRWINGPIDQGYNNSNLIFDIYGYRDVNPVPDVNKGIIRVQADSGVPSELYLTAGTIKHQGNSQFNDEATFNYQANFDNIAWFHDEIRLNNKDTGSSGNVITLPSSTNKEIDVSGYNQVFLNPQGGGAGLYSMVTTGTEYILSQLVLIKNISDDYEIYIRDAYSGSTGNIYTPNHDNAFTISPRGMVWAVYDQDGDEWQLTQDTGA